jgi:hypothetical protein
VANKPNWKKGDIVVLLNTWGRAISIFEAEKDPYYATQGTVLEDSPGWYYGLRDCDEIRLATQDDLQEKIKYQQETLAREQERLNILLSFKDRIDKPNESGTILEQGRQL